MADACLPHVGGCLIAITDLDEDGVPTPGAGHRLVSDALVSVAFTWVMDTPAEVKAENACGRTLVSYQAPPTIKRGQMTITMLTPDPYVSAVLGQGSVLTDGDAVGYASPRLGQLGEQAVGIEVWAKRIKDGKLDPDYPYAWWLYPWTQSWRPGDHTHANEILQPSYVGDVFENEAWWNGPLNDWPVSSDSAVQWIPTNSIPEAVCGPIAVAAS